MPTYECQNCYEESLELDIVNDLRNEQIFRFCASCAHKLLMTHDYFEYETTIRQAKNKEVKAMKNYQCEHCEGYYSEIEVLYEGSYEDEALVFVCPQCAHRIKSNDPSIRYIKTISFEGDQIKERREKQSLYENQQKNNVRYAHDKNGNTITIPQQTPEEIEQKRQADMHAKIDRSFQSMNAFVGMKHIKEKLKTILYRKEGKEYLKKHSNLTIENPLMHTIITGNPGTGKTELAKQLTKIYYESGVISEEKFTFVKAEELVGKHLGSSAPQTKEKIEQARGGIFFLDEAYRLNETGKGNGGTHFGLEVLETIMSAMESESEDVVFVFAGYPDKMERFLEQNEGLRSRIPNILPLYDYTLDELLEIALNTLQKRGYKTENAQDTLRQRLHENMTQGTLKGNGRTVHNYINKIVEQHMERILSTPNTMSVEYETLLPEDVHASFEKKGVDQERLKESYKIAKEKIHAMTGLQEVKEQLEEIGDYQFVQEKRKKLGLPTQKKSHHMFFLGAPGTGKTTMARLVGELLRGSGVLSNGHFVEATKEKLTKGESIPTTVQNLVNNAKGGILFLDEAYQLKNDGKGKEALDSLIASMENERDDLVVILAGYEKDMEGLMELNPGLASRVSNHLHFSSYNAEELTEIAFNLLQQNQFVLQPGASEALTKLISEAKEKDIVDGNGRWVRNLFEHIQVVQSKRLVKEELAGVVLIKDDYLTIQLPDIEATKQKLHLFSKPSKKKKETNEKIEMLKQIEERIEEIQKIKQII